MPVEKNPWVKIHIQGVDRNKWEAFIFFVKKYEGITASEKIRRFIDAEYKKFTKKFNQEYGGE